MGDVLDGWYDYRLVLLGELVIESTPGAGTTVIVRIPGGGSEDRRQ